MGNDAPLIGTAEAARLLGRTVSTVNRWASTGRLIPAAQGTGIRGPRFFRRADVVKLAERINSKQAA